MLDLLAGELVEVLSWPEIAQSLQANGTLDSLPFMPEMLKLCGRQLRVSKRADKTCDTIEKTGARRMRDTVHLEGVRCDGAAHGGCQAGCLLFWKEAWLKRPDGSGRPRGTAASDGSPGPPEEGLRQATRVPLPGGGERFVCQATELRKATSPLPWWDLRQYVRDVRSGNVGLAEIVRGILVRTAMNALAKIQHVPGTYRLAGAVRAGGRGLWRVPHIHGRVQNGPTPREVLNLQPGERVRVKSPEQIARTLDRNNKNRGLWFDVEMLKYCGGEFKVLRRVDRMINEKTGVMMELPNDCVILEDVTCCAHFAERRLFCPRSMYPYWREIWLERIE